MEKQIGQERLTGQVLRPEEARLGRLHQHTQKAVLSWPRVWRGCWGEAPPAARRKAQAPLHYGELLFLCILQTAPVPVSHWDCAQLEA